MVLALRANADVASGVCQGCRHHVVLLTPLTVEQGLLLKKLILFPNLRVPRMPWETYGEQR